MKNLTFIFFVIFVVATLSSCEIDLFGEYDPYPEETKALKDTTKSLFIKTQKGDYKSIYATVSPGSQAEKAFKLCELKKYVFKEDTASAMSISYGKDSISQKETARVKGSVIFPNNDIQPAFTWYFNKFDARLIKEKTGWVFTEFYIKNSSGTKHPNFVF